ncbi:MAG: phosphodiester glycosidase family protein [bacterium]|nr:phosphodiester glycosidase family protein [bacterium]
MAKNKVMKKKKKINLNIKRVFLLVLSIFVMGLSVGMFLLYGPYSWFRERWITTAMTTMSHQYLATMLFDNDTIQEVLARNKTIEPEEDTNPNLINTEDINTTKYSSKYEKQILENVKADELYRLIEVSGTGYRGYLVAIYDPSKVRIATTSKLGTTGQSVQVIAKNNDAVVAMNASGFFDPDWNSNGAIPHGTVIKNGKIVYDYEDARVGGGFIGFNEDHVLVLGRFSKYDAINKYKLRDAIEFGPFLIVNGKAAFVQGDGGWGLAPRSAIGQRQDGIVLFLVIDGRGRNSSIGCGMVELTEIMQKYGAYNAANLDGGSSSGLIINNEIINHPTAGGQNGLRNIPTAWIVSE